MLLFALIFAGAYGMAPLYTSNQNTYFFHGLAEGGMGSLSEDWLYQTADPFPVFSGMVSFIYQYLPEETFYLCHILLLILYLICIVEIIRNVGSEKSNNPSESLTLLTIIGLHSAAAVWFSLKILGISVDRWLFWGVAEQYVLGPGLQPSVFGVFLLLSIILFLADRKWAAIAAAVLSVYFHSSYLIAAGFLVFSYMIIIYIESKDLKKAGKLGIASLVLVLPIIWYILQNFSPADAETAIKAQTILIKERIPHHADLGYWFGGEAVWKILLHIIALFLIKNIRLLIIFSVLFGGGFLLSAVTAFTGNQQLALMFPWRVSVITTPIASAIIIKALIDRLSIKASIGSFLQKRYYLVIVLSCFGILFLFGLAFTYNEFKSVAAEKELPVMQYVKEHKITGDLYLIPPDLEKFRLYTGAAVFIDKKTHPYKDSEFLEWYRRLKISEIIYADEKTIDGEELTRILQNNKVTHFICHTASVLTGTIPGVQVYIEKQYTVYEVKD